jgi:hypothetical protein
VKERFIGAWELESFVFRMGATPVYPAGNNAVGLLIYHADGSMAAQIMRVDRPPIEAGDQQRATDSEARAAFEGYLAYYGPYSIDEAGGKVVHHVAGSLYPNWVGTDQVRLFEFEDEQLVLSTEPLHFGGQEVRAFMRWNRSYAGRSCSATEPRTRPQRD